MGLLVHWKHFDNISEIQDRMFYLRLYQCPCNQLGYKRTVQDTKPRSIMAKDVFLVAICPLASFIIRTRRLINSYPSSSMKNRLEYVEIWSRLDFELYWNDVRFNPTHVRFGYLISPVRTKFISSVQSWTDERSYGFRNILCWSFEVLL